jgi:hypothetical protein
LEKKADDLASFGIGQERLDVCIDPAVVVVVVVDEKWLRWIPDAEKSIDDW